MWVRYFFNILLLKNDVFPCLSIEKLAQSDPINMLILLSILDPIDKADIPKNVSPAPTVSILFLLKAGQEITEPFLQFTKTAPNFPLVTIIF